MFSPSSDGWKEIPVKAFFRRIGPLYARRTEVGWEYGLLTTEEHDNSMGVVHGGVLAAFADQALSTVAWEAAQRRAASTISLDLHYARSVKPGQFITVQGRVVSAGMSLIFLAGTITCEGDGVAIASGVWKVARPVPGATST